MPLVPKHRQILGTAIRECRKHAGLTQETLAERSEVSVIFLSLLENGHRTVSVDALMRIAKAVGTRVCDLVADL